jgi:hypothetical protein
MTIKNSQIRAEARYLLDDNVLGKDWIKAAFMHFYADILIFTIGAFMVTFAHSTVIPFLLTLFIDTNPVLEIGISLFVELLNLALLNVLIGPVSVGFASVYTDLVRGEGKINFPKFFSGFKNFFENFIEFGFDSFWRIAGLDEYISVFSCLECSLFSRNKSLRAT